MNYKSVLVTVANNEDLYIEEWLSYHLKLGFSEIVVFQNNWRYNEDGIFRSDKRVRFLIADGKFDANLFQYSTVNKFVDDEGRKYDFIAFFDVDEFLVLKDSDTLDGFWRKIECHPAVFIHWRIFGDNDLSGKPQTDYSVLRRFTRSARTLFVNGKSILTKKGMTSWRWKSVHSIGHISKTTNVSCPGCPFAEVNHYRNKTREERLTRWKGGDDNDEWWDKFNSNDIENTWARDFLYEEYRKSDNIEWERYFDRVFCGFFLPNKNRLSRLEDELRRVNLLDNPIFEWEWFTPSVFDSKALDNIHDRNHLRIFKPSYANHLKNFEEILRIAEEKRYRRILIIEDDIAFLRDKRKIVEILDSMPDGHHAFQMDKFVPENKKEMWKKIEQEGKINDNWVSSKGGFFTSAGCNAFTEEGIREMLRIIETTPGSVDQLSVKFMKPWAISRYNIAIQCLYGDAVNLQYGTVKRIHDSYSLLNYKDYSVPSSYGNRSVL